MSSSRFTVKFKGWEGEQLQGVLDVHHTSDTVAWDVDGTRCYIFSEMELDALEEAIKQYREYRSSLGEEKKK